MTNVSTRFIFFVLFVFVHIAVAPPLLLFPPFLSSCASTYLFLLLSMYSDTDADFAKPKSGSLHAYMAFLTMFQLVMFIYLNKTSTSYQLPYSSLAHAIMIMLLFLLTFKLFKDVNNQDAHSKERYVRSMNQIFPFFVLVCMCYTSLVTMNLVEKIHHSFFQNHYNPSIWYNYSTLFRVLKSLVQFLIILGWLGAIIASLVFLVNQSQELSN